jgi:Uma2 family endonuclease
LELALSFQHGRTEAAISVDEYLHTAFPDQDMEYDEGEIVERRLPDNLHSTTQALLIEFFALLKKTIPLHPRPELRLRIRERLCRIPDVSVFHPEPPTEAVPSTPPFIAIEIFSTDDRMTQVRAKLEEYRTWGVPHVWLVDPHAKRMYQCSDGLTEVAVLRIPELGIEVRPEDLFE